MLDRLAAEIAATDLDQVALARDGGPC
jgi:hypothetical protein